MKYEINPSPGGRECLRDGEHFDEKGGLIDCYCGECPEYLVCFGDEVKEYFINEINKRRDSSI